MASDDDKNKTSSSSRVSASKSLMMLGPIEEGLYGALWLATGGFMLRQKKGEDLIIIKPRGVCSRRLQVADLQRAEVRSRASDGKIMI